MCGTLVLTDMNKKEEEEEFTPSIELLKSISFLAVILTL
jgi:hypothetical protein